MIWILGSTYMAFSIICTVVVAFIYEVEEGQGLCTFVRQEFNKCEGFSETLVYIIQTVLYLIIFPYVTLLLYSTKDEEK